MKITHLAIALGLAFVSTEARAEKLVIKGSDTLGAKLVPQLAEQFKAQHPGTTFDIAAEGSTTGIAAIIDSTAQIGMASRRAKPAEVSAASAKGVHMKPTIVAYDGIAVIVNSANPIKSLTKKQVEQIFTGEVADWSAVGGSSGKFSIYTRNTSSGTYSDFKELAMKKRDYAGTSQKMAGNEQIAAEVGKNANGVGYVGLAYTKASGIKVMSIDGVLPSVQTVHAKTYPYARPTFYYTNGDPSGLAKQFLDFTISGAGQKIVGQVGFVPIP
ncbi:MAG TPA: phosphate ABC transporter substrate-binding protein [Chthoniobacterales bacterium]